MLLLLVFLVLAILFVQACDRIIGPDEAALEEVRRAPSPAPEPPTEQEKVA